MVYFICVLGLIAASVAYVYANEYISKELTEHQLKMLIIASFIVLLCILTIIGIKVFELIQTTNHLNQLYNTK